MAHRFSTVSDTWQQLIASARQRWNRLSDDELQAVRGNAERLVSLLQARYGFAREQALREMMAWRKTLVVTAGRAA